MVCLLQSTANAPEGCLPPPGAATAAAYFCPLAATEAGERIYMFRCRAHRGVLVAIETECHAIETIPSTWTKLRLRVQRQQTQPKRGLVYDG